MKSRDLMLRYLFTDRAGDSCYAIEEKRIAPDDQDYSPESLMFVIGTVRFAPLTSKRTRLLEWKEPEKEATVISNPTMEKRRNNLGTL